VQVFLRAHVCVSVSVSDLVSVCLSVSTSVFVCLIFVCFSLILSYCLSRRASLARASLTCASLTRLLSRSVPSSIEKIYPQTVHLCSRVCSPHSLIVSRSTGLFIMSLFVYFGLLNVCLWQQGATELVAWKTSWVTR